jgi:hypothetical protein
MELLLSVFTWTEIRCEQSRFYAMMSTPRAFRAVGIAFQPMRERWKHVQYNLTLPVIWESLCIGRSTNSLIGGLAAETFPPHRKFKDPCWEHQAARRAASDGTRPA